MILVSLQLISLLIYFYLHELTVTRAEAWWWSIRHMVLIDTSSWSSHYLYGLQ
jgi:hypothetical protein